MGLLSAGPAGSGSRFRALNGNNFPYWEGFGGGRRTCQAGREMHNLLKKMNNYLLWQGVPEKCTQIAPNGAANRETQRHVACCVACVKERVFVNAMSFICTAAVMLLAMAWAEYYVE